MEKLDKNESARSLALEFGRFKNVCWLLGGGGGGNCPSRAPLATALLSVFVCCIATIVFMSLAHSGYWLVSASSEALLPTLDFKLLSLLLARRSC